jgi:hypothetical protein
MVRRCLISTLAACGFAACGSDPVSYSAPVSINLKAKSGDVSGTTISENKAITTETGNPYGAFVGDARAKLGGKDPSRIEIDALVITLGAQSVNVTTLDNVFSGDVDAAILLDDSSNTYDAGHVMDPTGVGPVAMTVTFQAAAIAPQDTAKFLAGGFKVVLRGNAGLGFATKGAEANLELTFTFAAFE